MTDDRATRRRDLSNALAAMTNGLWTIQHTNKSYDEKIRVLTEIAKLIPLCVRYLIYFKNTGE